MNIFKEARERKGITQRELSQKMNYATPQFVSNWERGISLPPVRSLKTLCSEIDLELNGVIEFILDKKIKHFKNEMLEELGEI